MIEGQNGVSWPQWVELAAACERAGVSALLRSDHYRNLARDDRFGSLDAWATLAGLAAITSRLRLGTLVSPATFRHPSELAKVVTTVDHISGGRVELGIGAGWNEPEHRAYGFPFPPVAERMERLTEQLEVLHAHWGCHPRSFSGAHYRIEDLTAMPRPVQSPHPRLILGGWGKPRSLQLAARYADEYNTPYVTAAELAALARRIDAASAKAGRPTLAISVLCGVILASDEHELHQRAELVAQRVGKSENADQLLDRVSASWLIGTPEAAAERLHELRDAGAARVILQHFQHEDLDTVALIGDLSRSLA